MPEITGLTLSTLTLLGSVAIAAAQSAPDPHHPNAPAPAAKAQGGMPPAGMPMMDMGMMAFDHIEGRLAFLKTELGITDAQLPQWNMFADTLRTSVKGMRSAMGGLMQGDMPTTAPARMDAMVQMMSARLETMKTMQAAAKQLYAVLSDEQKKTADELMTEPMMGMQMGGMRAKGMGDR